MKTYTKICIVLAVGVLLSAGVGFEAVSHADSFANAPKKTVKRPHRSIRLYLPNASKKTVLRGMHWVTLSTAQKHFTVELARKGALKMGVLMTLPAEIYMERLDKLFILEPSTQKIEVGQAVQGIAIALHDWDNGKSPLTVKEEYLGKAPAKT